jgi:hypothetical protein
MAAAALGLALASLGAAPADTPLPPQVADTVPGHPGVTYLDLLRQAIPDLAYNPATKQVEGRLKSLRHIAGNEAQADPPDPLVADFVEPLDVKAGGKRRLALLVELGQAEDSAASMDLLALYDDAPKPRLLDAVDVGMDKQTSLNADPSVIPLGPGDDAIVTLSGHGNSNQGYAQRLIIFVRNDRFHLLDDISLLSDTYCGFKREERPTFATQPGSPYASLIVTVTETLTHLDEDCSDQKVPAPYVHTYRTTYRWDPAKRDFVGRGDMARLDKLNEKRF